MARLNLDFLLIIAISSVAILFGVLAGIGFSIGLAIALFAGFLLLMLILTKRPWIYLLWILICGLSIWSYGFNNIPLVRPVPLVDVLLLLIVVLGLRYWWGLMKTNVVRRLFIFLLFLLIFIFFRLIVDVPRFGLLAIRDALFAFELWIVFPAIALGYRLGEHSLNRKLLWFFCVNMVWYLLYPWRELLESISPVVGIQRPVALFAFTTAGFISVPMFFWFLRYPNRMLSFVGSSASLLILLFAQIRGGYLAFLGNLIVMLLLSKKKKAVLTLIIHVILVTILVQTIISILSIYGIKLEGRLGEPIGLSTALQQLGTLVGNEGPGAGSFRHRLMAWPAVIEQVLSEPFGPLFGLGLGPDLFQGFSLGPDIPVRKPHNDYLEIWARLGIVGLFPWLCILIILGWEVLKKARENPDHAWILALQITLWIECASQPAMGFAYIVIPWSGLTGLWIGAQLLNKKLDSAVKAHPRDTGTQNIQGKIKDSKTFFGLWTKIRLTP